MERAEFLSHIHDMSVTVEEVCDKIDNKVAGLTTDARVETPVALLIAIESTLRLQQKLLVGLLEENETIWDKVQSLVDKYGGEDEQPKG
jgi:hypothetical protein